MELDPHGQVHGLLLADLLVFRPRDANFGGDPPGSAAWSSCS